MSVLKREQVNVSNFKKIKNEKRAPQAHFIVLLIFFKFKTFIFQSQCDLEKNVICWEGGGGEFEPFSSAWRIFAPNLVPLYGIFQPCPCILQRHLSRNLTYNLPPFLIASTSSLFKQFKIEIFSSFWVQINFFAVVSVMSGWNHSELSINVRVHSCLHKSSFFSTVSFFLSKIQYSNIHMKGSKDLTWFGCIKMALDSSEAMNRPKYAEILNFNTWIQLARPSWIQLARQSC